MSDELVERSSSIAVHQLSLYLIAVLLLELSLTHTQTNDFFPPPLGLFSSSNQTAGDLVAGGDVNKSYRLLKYLHSHN